MKTTMNESAKSGTVAGVSFRGRKSVYWNSRRRYVPVGYFESASYVK